MRDTGLIAMAELAMHKREHIVVLRPGGKGLIAHTMFYASELRSQDEYPVNATLVKPKELELATALVKGLTTHFDPSKFRDTYREKLEALIATKVQDAPQRVDVPKAPPPQADITQALKESLAQPTPELRSLVRGEVPAGVSSHRASARRSEAAPFSA